MKTCGAAVARTVLICFQTCIASGAVLGFQDSPRLSLVLAFVLTTSLCDTFQIHPERLVAPFWHKIRGFQPTLALNSTSLAPASTHRLCTIPQNKRDTYPTPNVRISRSRAPPPLP